MHLVYFAPAIIFGLYYFFHGDISIERFRSLLSSENAVEEIETDSPDFETALSTGRYTDRPMICFAHFADTLKIRL